MSNKKIINVVKGDIKNAIQLGTYTRNTSNYANIEFDTKDKLIMLDGVPYSGKPLTEVTYSELRNLRDNNLLAPGTFYRITNYECTTSLENTQSAGHNFDIVLLALSEDSLLEEGWAIRNENNLYDVTFSDNVTKKCWIYFDGSHYNIVDDKTQLGNNSLSSGGITLDFSAKTASCPTLSSTSLTIENLNYNNDYFKNSNLNAWKVWYCLDNDVNRFEWALAEKQVLGELIAFIPSGASSNNTYYRTEETVTAKQSLNSSTMVTRLKWVCNDNGNTYYIYTDLDNFYYKYLLNGTGDNKYFSASFWGNGGQAIMETITIPEGKGVIYRMIDEYGNDCPYDFKNIQYRLDNEGFIYINSGGNSGGSPRDINYGYTFSYFDENYVYDASMNVSVQNKISPIYKWNFDKPTMVLPLIQIINWAFNCDLQRCYNINIYSDEGYSTVQATNCLGLLISGGVIQANSCINMALSSPGIYWNNLMITLESEGDYNWQVPLYEDLAH